MATHLHRQIDKLKTMISTLAAMVEQSVADALDAVHRFDVDAARKVIDADDAIDQYELEVEEECLHTLALHQPVAFDLRYIIAILKINNELERIGDLAVNVADQAHFLAEERQTTGPLPFNLDAMARHARDMLRQSLDALVNVDADQARRVRRLDNQLDVSHRAMYDRVAAAIRADADKVELYMHTISVSRNLERIGDHAVNIAEDVLYITEGDIFRHPRAPSDAASPDASSG
ncbi:MAG: phosphate signaling complex protein PhoU [Phycisphaeraceae bacterium]